MPAGVVPTDRELGLGVAIQQFDQEIRGRHTLGFRVGRQVHLARLGVNRTIKRLPLLEVADGDLDPLVAFPPGVAAHIAPEQKTLVQEQQHSFAAFEGFLML